MSFSAVKVTYLQRLVEERPIRRRAGDAARFFCDHYSIGSLVGNQVEYRPEHHQAAEGLLRTHDLPITALGPNATRADSAIYGGMSEKSLSLAPHAKSVAIKCLGHCTLDGRELFTPEGSYLVMTPERAQRVTCTRLMVVENLETFRALEAYRWIDLKGMDVLAIYRGDTKLSAKDADDVIKARSEPIWGFYDFDPAGLAMANALPPGRLERVVLPDLDWLKQAANTPRGRQLFDAQLEAFGATLEQSLHPQIKSLWQVMTPTRGAVTQERMLGAAATI
jgi:hypothetical protein